MLLGGDELCRSQRGNNNAYCQDNEMSWVDWSLLRQDHEVFRFTCRALAFRRSHSVLRREAFYTGTDIRWFSPRGDSPNWNDPRQKCLACLIRGQDGPDLFLMFNAGIEPIRFVLPPQRLGAWCLAVDTAQPPPRDFCSPEVELIDPRNYVVDSRAGVVLVAR